MMEDEKCSVCRKVIEKWDRPVMGTAERFYHVNCFVCHDCKRSMVNDFFVERVSVKEVELPGMFIPMQMEMIKLACVACEEKNTKVRVCPGCNKPFQFDHSVILGHQRYWHPTCFVCAKCNRPLTREFYIQDGKHYCVKVECGFPSESFAPTTGNVPGK